MNKEELFLKTAFCFMACDGRIEPQEIEVMKDYISKYNLEIKESANIIDSYVNEINKNSASFFKKYISEVAVSSLDTEAMLTLIKIAMDMIESDNVIEYSEIAFFKKVREVIPISDSTILDKYPDKEDYLLPDSNSDYDFGNTLSFDIHKINMPKKSTILFGYQIEE